MDFYDLPARLTVRDADGNVTEEREITVHKIGYYMRVSKDQQIFEDMFSPHYHGPLTKEETEYREYEEYREDLDLYEEEWE